ncbi:GGDEF domain-containing protein [Sphingobium sufflavum]|uniref:GGDEF domain-containing protein n=1 Tax=Sphingobium sufflavum TaxID=1129547 RepID=UPI001F217C33|nr:GGDEF domain-containing protein [Sphingobium sufflavum]MCE7795459.1 GGDEF domain-containing protein [Sphingobium sufflavum]
MSFSADLATLRLCSVLASLAFTIIFLALWRGRRDQRHYAHWAVSLIVYCLALAGLELIENQSAGLWDSLFLAMLAGSNISVVMGARLFLGRPLWRWWMALPVAATLLAFLVPGWLEALGVATGPFDRRMMTPLGLALGMALFGHDLIRLSRQGAVTSQGCRVAGLALWGYIPCYGLAVLGEVQGWATPTTVAVLGLASDQLLLMLLNLGLLAMPAEAAFAALRDSAWRDALTGVYNRAWLAGRDGALLVPGTRLALIDIDHFKAVNDRFGHAAGDAALVRLSRILGDAAQAPAMPGGVHVVRMGGDEFLVILSGASATDADRFAAAVRAAIRQAGPLRWTISMGMAQVEPQDASLADGIARADRRLYAAKTGGRDRVAA